MYSQAIREAKTRQVEKRNAHDQVDLEAENNENLDVQENVNMEVLENANLSVLENANMEVLENANLEVLENANLKMLENANLEVLENANLELLENTNMEVLENANLEVLENANLEVLENANLEVLENADLEVLENANLEVLDNANMEVLEYTYLELLENANFEVLENANLEVLENANLEVLENENQTGQMLVPNKDVLLIKDNMPLFKAKYTPFLNTETVKTVHHRPLLENEDRFIITQVYNENMNDYDYDEDFHVSGSFIKWDTRCISHSETAVNVTLPEKIMINELGEQNSNEVYLMYFRYRVFLAEPVEHHKGEVVNGRTVSKGSCKFLIKEVYTTFAKKIKGFDSSTMCPGGYIIWKTDKTKRKNVPCQTYTQQDDQQDDPRCCL